MQSGLSDVCVDVNLVGNILVRFMLGELFNIQNSIEKESEKHFRGSATYEMRLACAIRSLTKTHTRSLITVIRAQETRY